MEFVRTLDSNKKIIIDNIETNINNFSKELFKLIVDSEILKRNILLHSCENCMANNLHKINLLTKSLKEQQKGLKLLKLFLIKYEKESRNNLTVIPEEPETLYCEIEPINH